MSNQYSKNLLAFTKTIKELRLAENATQKEIALKLGITAESYRAYEAGIALPTLQNFIKLCEIFDVTPNDLLDIR